MDGDEDPEVEEEKAVLLGTRELEELDPAVAGSLLVARCTFGVLDMSQNYVYAIMPVIERVLDFQVLHDRWTLHTPRETPYSIFWVVRQVHPKLEIGNPGKEFYEIRLCCK